MAGDKEMAGLERQLWTFEERVKHALIPSGLYIRYKVLKERWRGEAEFGLLDMLVDRRRNAIDAGANKGTFSHVLSRLAQQVYAFEPNPKMFAILKRSAAANVAVSPLALSDRAGDAEFLIPRRANGRHSNQGGSLSRIKVHGDHLALPVRMARIDDLDLPDIGFIKIDVEGSEMAVLEGAHALLARDRPTLMIEMEEAHTRRPIEESLQKVMALGYRGLFFDRSRGCLRLVEDFDPETMHRQRDQGYVFNFIFLPV
jgi:FkbM family methyltransferase